MEEEKKEGHHEPHHTEAHHPEHTLPKHHPAKKLNNYYIFVGLSVLLAIIILFSIMQTFSINSALKDKTEKAKELAKPAKIELSVIKNSKCTDCFDILQIVEYIKSAKVEVTSEKNVEFDSAEGKQLVAKYNLEKIPNVVVTGEIDKANLEGFEKKNNALIFTQIPPPYTNATSGEVKGRISLVILADPTCTKCDNITTLVNQMKSSGIIMAEQKNVNSNSDEGKSLIAKYNIGFVPTIILSKDAGAYPIINQAWGQLGTVESDGSHVLRTVYPPYINLTTGNLRGIVDITYLTDKSCTECYNVSTHRQILASPQTFAIKIDKETTVDVSDAEGKSLVLKYNITQVPTVIMSSEVSVYPASQALNQFFSVEKDGSYIFRKLSVVGVYRDLTTNQVVKPQTATQ
ncbi:MAG: hypothetical protein AABX32_04015 [Nanoarchaeota archaeon]